MARFDVSFAVAATQVRGGCLFGNKVLGVGAHTFNPCMQMICDMNGQITFVSCPRITCNPGMEIIGYQPENNAKPYPLCCPQPICKPVYNEPYAQP